VLPAILYDRPVSKWGTIHEQLKNWLNKHTFLLLISPERGGAEVYCLVDCRATCR
jgi:hypothetical protein